MTIDGLFLPEDPTKLWSDGKVHPDVEYMTGLNSEEASIILTFLPSKYYLPLLEYGIGATHPLLKGLLDYARLISYPGLEKDIS